MTIYESNWYPDLTILSLSIQHEFPTADTTSGKVKGYYKYSYGKRQFAAFEGIPYIKQPLGDLRFEEPQNPDSWSGVFEATKTYNCIQKFPTYPISGEEDCIYLNVYVPRPQPIPDENLDVIVYIHGGAFIAGNCDEGGPGFIMDKDVVYVNFNYRIGILGFLSTGDSEIPGNYGLKDQVFALKWVRDNIRYFGGNPNSVTLAGMSAGAASVHYQYFSPLSKGLFHRGYSLSGTAFAPWTLLNNPLETAEKLGKAVGCSTSSTRILKKCLKSKSARALYDQMSAVYVVPGFPLAPFAPVIEKPSKTAFITKNPYLLLKEGNVHDLPWIASDTTHEGLLALMILNYTTFEKNYEQYVPYVLSYYDKINDGDKHLISKKIKQFYIDKENYKIKNVVKAFGDRLFIMGLETAVRMHAKITKSPVYSCIYGYYAETIMGPQLSPSNSIGGVGHGDDGHLLYDTIYAGQPIRKTPLMTKDEELKNVLVRILTSFAADGIPKLGNITWKAVSGNENLEYLYIGGTDNITMVYSKELYPLSFWDSLPIRLSIQYEFPTADTTLGKVKGHYKHSYGKRQFAAFEGIPYIKPPLGDLRFEEPQNPDSWSEVFEATQTYNCIQQFPTYPISGEEDCIYLNVYVPRPQPIPDENLDVIVYIHGGAFISGSCDEGGPGFLMEKDIVYVTFNYRIGILGFLSTGDSEIPGNYGLKDQVFALKWVRDNIKYFGGNPNSVTLAGMSAGAASVHYQYFSPLSKGLFHRGYSLSGTAFAPWTLLNNALETAEKLGKAVGCSTSSTRILKECLKSKSARALYDQMSAIYVVPGFPLAPFAPVIENPSKTAFITKNPYLLLKEGDVHDLPWIASDTTHEGLLALMILNYTTFEMNYEQYVPYVLSYYDKIQNEAKQFISTKIKEFYIDIDDHKIKNFVKACGDRLFNEGLETAVRMNSKITKSPVYSYIFGYIAETKMNPELPLSDSVRCAGHAEDGRLLYDAVYSGKPIRKTPLTTKDEEMKDMLVEMLTSFAADGIPKFGNITWKPVSGHENLEHLYIGGPDNIAMVYSKELCPLSFWNSLPILEYDKLET
ncbi:hypothetical protein FQA39_LY01810 [Lamprigera yunnana]|nr:hypothetical protein FQA39_LY01810 [Lamprigera yunnana]